MVLQAFVSSFLVVVSWFSAGFAGFTENQRKISEN